MRCRRGIGARICVTSILDLSIVKHISAQYYYGLKGLSTHDGSPSMVKLLDRFLNLGDSTVMWDEVGYATDTEVRGRLGLCDIFGGRWIDILSIMELEMCGQYVQVERVLIITLTLHVPTLVFHVPRKCYGYQREA